MGKEIERNHHFQSEQLIHLTCVAWYRGRFGTEKMCVKMEDEKHDQPGQDRVSPLSQRRMTSSLNRFRHFFIHGGHFYGLNHHIVVMMEYNKNTQSLTHNIIFCCEVQVQ